MGISPARQTQMATFHEIYTIERGQRHVRWCVSPTVDPRSLTAAYVEEVEIRPPEEEWMGKVPPEPQVMACLPEF